MKYIFLFILLSSSIFANRNLSYFLKNGSNGDYIVVKHEKIFTLLSIEKKSDIATLYEISIPQNKVNLKKFNWKKWVNNGAKDNISWVAFEIDLEKGKIIKGYSFSEKKIFNIKNEENIFSSLLTKNLKYLENDKRRKIGPPPMRGELDIRSSWNPPYIFEGKRKKSIMDVYQVKLLNEKPSKIVDLYFPKDKNFSFPIWIQVNTDHLRILLKTVDSGRGLIINKSFPKTNFSS